MRMTIVKLAMQDTEAAASAVSDLMEGVFLYKTRLVISRAKSTSVAVYVINLSIAASWVGS